MSSVQQAHSNLYCRGFPPEFAESDLLQLFAPHGDILSIRVVAGGEQAGQQAAAPHAFVKYEHPTQAQTAIQALHGSSINGCQLVVKFADADVQPRVESGRQPSEWCYCRNLPASYTRQDVGEMFVPYGTVLEIRLFPSTELYKGSGALVQMQSVEQASAAIHSLNGSFPRGATQPLLVRYADSPAEKAAKQARKERLFQKQTAGTSPLFSSSSLLAAQLQQQLIGLAMGGSGHLPAGGMTSTPELSHDLPSMLSIEGFSDSSGSLPTASAVLQQQAAAAAVLAPPGQQPGSPASIYIKGMPEDADKLWLYEKFARFGGIASVRVLIDEQSGKCNGIGFVNFVGADAARLAQESMNGVNMGDRLLHVMVQNPSSRSRSSPAAPSSASPASMGHPLPSPSAVSLQPRQASVSAVQAAANLGLNANTLASLQAASAAGMMASPNGGGSMHQPNGLPMAMGYGGGGMGGQPVGGAYGQLQW